MRVITVQALKKVFKRIIDKLEYEQVQEINLKTDYYKIIPTDAWNNYEEDVVILGSLDDDIKSIELLVDDPDRPCTYVDLDRVASILRAISQEINPVEKN